MPLYLSTTSDRNLAGNGVSGNGVSGDIGADNRFAGVAIGVEGASTYTRAVTVKVSRGKVGSDALVRI